MPFAWAPDSGEARDDGQRRRGRSWLERKRATKRAALAILGLALIAWWAGATPTAGQSYFVSPRGDDSADGSRAAPFRTIGRAAALAEAGDVVRVQAGSYAERVVVAHGGKPGRPILFVADPPGRVELTGDAGFQPKEWAGDDDIHAASGGGSVTLRGFAFRNIATPFVVRASQGWRIEDCVFQHTGFGINIRGNDVAVERTSFEDVDGPNAHALVAFGVRGPRIEDVTIRRVNATREIAEIPRSAVTKFGSTTGLVIERLLSEDNVGPGLWLDWDNRDFTIRHSVIRRNAGDHFAWEGGGLWLEGNGEANGTIADNLIADNSGSGIAIMESNGLEIRNNRLLGNGNCFELRNLPRDGDGDRTVGALDISHNFCARPQQAAVVAAVGDWAGWNASARSVVFRRNTYDLRNHVPAFDWLGQKLGSVAEATRVLGVESSLAIASKDHRP